MSIITGVAQEAFDDFAEDFESGSLQIVVGWTADGQGGRKPTYGDPIPCLVLLTDYSDYRRQTLGIPATDRLVLVLGASLPSGITPAKGHRITAPDPAKGLLPTTFEVIAKTGDPAAALYKLQAR